MFVYAFAFAFAYVFVYAFVYVYVYGVHSPTVPTTLAMVSSSAWALATSAGAIPP